MCEDSSKGDNKRKSNDSKGKHSLNKIELTDPKNLAGTSNRKEITRVQKDYNILKINT